MMIIVFLVISYTYRRYITSSARVQVEDALSDACLAAALVDPEIFGSNEMRVENYNYADLYSKFSASLKAGLGLNEDFTPTDDIYMASAVTVEEFYIYNFEVNGSGYIVAEELCRYVTGGSYTPGSDMYTPASIERYEHYDNPSMVPLYIKSTPNDKTLHIGITIYAKVSFKLKGLFGISYPVSKEQSVDVIKA